MLHTRDKYETLARHHRNEVTKSLLTLLFSWLKEFMLLKPSPVTSRNKEAQKQ